MKKKLKGETDGYSYKQNAWPFIHPYIGFENKISRRKKIFITISFESQYKAFRAEITIS